VICCPRSMSHDKPESWMPSSSSISARRHRVQSLCSSPPVIVGPRRL
jgi:hypothetical protein